MTGTASQSEAVLPERSWETVKAVSELFTGLQLMPAALHSGSSFKSYIGLRPYIKIVFFNLYIPFTKLLQSIIAQKN